MAQLILDVMGGDKAPHSILQGAVLALEDLKKQGAELILVGDQNACERILEHRRFSALRKALKDPHSGVRWENAPDSIDMHDSIKSLRQKPGASINVGCRMAAESWKHFKNSVSPRPPAAFISAGHSGAMMASALIHMGRLKGVERPGIAVTLPTLSADGCVVLDVGANVDCKPEHLRDFAVMGALYAQVDRKSEGLPRVGILSNGEERSKGNELTRAALALIDQLPHFDKIARFQGYAEGKEIFKGVVDVVITDGFVGNVVLKSVEGLGSAVVQILKEGARKSPIAAAGLILAAPIFRGLKKRLDYAEYGAAPLLGVAGYAFICHGRSNPKAIRNALIRAHIAQTKQVVEGLENALLENLRPPPAPSPTRSS
ncbi:MAG: acyl phosphate synthase [Pseudomonadota bacterium]|jgi:glycerol-3-phosphate acyltransferase PlsX